MEGKTDDFKDHTLIKQKNNIEGIYKIIFLYT
jgi:hypothetical protein